MRNRLKILLREGLLNEYEVLPYKETGNYDGRIMGRFEAEGLTYNIELWHDDNKHDFGVYELSFDVGMDQAHSASRQGKDIKHLNNVLYTVDDFTEKMVKKYKIKLIKVDGARDEQDDDRFDTLRGKLYARFLLNKYPSSAIEVNGRMINIDMTHVYPDLFSEEKGGAETLVDLLVDISDEDPDEAGIRRGLYGESDDDFGIDTDFIVNSKFGSIYFQIHCSKQFGEYDVSWDLMDRNENGFESFDSFDKLYRFLFDKFASHKAGYTPDGPDPKMKAEHSKVSEILGCNGRCLEGGEVGGNWELIKIKGDTTIEVHYSDDGHNNEYEVIISKVIDVNTPSDELYRKQFDSFEEFIPVLQIVNRQA